MKAICSSETSIDFQPEYAASCLRLQSSLEYNPLFQDFIAKIKEEFEVVNGTWDHVHMMCETRNKHKIYIDKNAKY
jgi:hypothetical protein